MSPDLPVASRYGISFRISAVVCRQCSMCCFRPSGLAHGLMRVLGVVVAVAVGGAEVIDSWRGSKGGAAPIADAG